jgi:hypothetical protein
MQEDKQMAVKLNLKLQTPTIELKLNVKDASGASDTVLVGFKRYSFNEAKERFESFSNSDALIDDVLKEEIVYVKQMKLVLEDENGKTRDLLVADSRTQKPVESLWGEQEGKECLSVLVDLLLDSAPYRGSLIDAMNKALLNMNFGDDSVKN